MSWVMARDTSERLSPPKRRALLVLFLLVTGLAALNAGGHTYAYDNEVQYQTTLSLAHLRPDLQVVDSYFVTQGVNGPYREREDGTYTGIVGIGHSIVALPFYAASRAVGQVLPTSYRETFVRTGTFFTNSAVLGLLAVVIALLALELKSSFRAAIAIALAYCFATYAMPHAKSFFTELTSALAVTLATYAALRYKRTGSHRALALCAFAAGFGVLTRASAILFLFVIVAWLVVVSFTRGRVREVWRAAVSFTAGGIVPLGLFLFFNWWRFGSPTDIGYPRVPQEYPFMDGFTKLFWTPGKSLFLFAPIIILGIIGLVVGLRRMFMSVALIGGLALSNIVLFSRVPYWAGDAAWGPRYQQIILPLLCVPAVIVAGKRWYTTAFAGLAGFGFVLPALLGSLIYFNVWYVNLYEIQVYAYDVVEYVEWQPFLGQLDLLSAGVRDVIDANLSGENDRGQYSLDPHNHYGYFGWEPRLDFWWLWAEPTGQAPAAYVYFVPIGALFGLASFVGSGRDLPEPLRRLGRRRPSRHRLPAGEPTPPTEASIR